jgi:uncharacterized membrane protein YgcG
MAEAVLRLHCAPHAEEHLGKALASTVRALSGPVRALDSSGTLKGACDRILTKILAAPPPPPLRAALAAVHAAALRRRPPAQAARAVARLLLGDLLGAVVRTLCAGRRREGGGLDSPGRRFLVEVAAVFRRLADGGGEGGPAARKDSEPEPAADMDDWIQRRRRHVRRLVQLAITQDAEGGSPGTAGFAGACNSGGAGRSPLAGGGGAAANEDYLAVAHLLTAHRDEIIRASANALHPAAAAAAAATSTLAAPWPPQASLPAPAGLQGLRASGPGSKPAAVAATAAAARMPGLWAAFEAQRSRRGGKSPASSSAQLPREGGGGGSVKFGGGCGGGGGVEVGGGGGAAAGLATSFSLQLMAGVQVSRGAGARTSFA